MDQDQQLAAQQPERERARYSVVKTSLKFVLRNQDTLGAFRTLVVNMDRILRFSYAFARFIRVVCELANNPDEFAPLYGSLWATELFFKELIKKVGGVATRHRRLSVVGQQGQETAAERRTRERFQHLNMIDLHWDMCLVFSGHQLDAADCIDSFASNISTYAAKQMESTYLNLVKTEFGKRLRQLIDSILNVRTLETEIKSQMRASTSDEVESMIREVVRVPARRFKVALATALGTGNRGLPDAIRGSIFEVHWNTFGFLLNCYPAGRAFRQNSVDYDCQAEQQAYLYALEPTCLEATIGKKPKLKRTFKTLTLVPKTPM